MNKSDETSPALRTKLINYFKDFLLNASVGGLANIVRAENIFLRLFWIIYLGCSVAYCSNLIYNSVLDFLQYDVISKTDVIFENQPHFPKLRVCKNEAPFILNNQNLQCFFNLQICRPLLSNKGINCLEFNTGRKILSNLYIFLLQNLTSILHFLFL